MKFNTDAISKSLNIKSIGEIDFDISQDEKWNCYTDDVIDKMRNTTAFYWNNLTEEGKKERLKNHGMTGKKHTSQTIEKMKNSSKKSKPHLHKSGRLTKNGEIVEFSCLTHFCKEHKLSRGHISELLQGKRKSVKGWKNVI